MESLELLKKTVSINSIFGNESRLGEFLEQQLKEAGFETRRIPISDGRFNVVGERGTRGKPVLFYGHMDTVPVYGNWKSDPFAIREEGGNLFGLGVFDMKAGVAATLKACETATDRRIKVAFGVDEENISEGSHALLKSGFFSDVEVAVTGEISTARGECLGPRQITLGRRGRCVIEITVPGRSAHGAQAEKGISAISEAARLVSLILEMDGAIGSHELLPAPTQFIRKINAESTSLSIPDTATIEVDRHLVVPQTPQSALSEVSLFIGGLYSRGVFSEIDGKRITARLKNRATPYLAPYVTPKENPFVQSLSMIVEARAGKASYAYGTSVADENVIASLGIPVISIGPMGGNEHSANEWITKKSYLQLVGIFEDFIRAC
ncbi:MAG: M20/M25/M40 family metallo-hydrolase [Candidatus Micrarchaeia archaeon]